MKRCIWLWRGLPYISHWQYSLVQPQWRAAPLTGNTTAAAVCYYGRASIAYVVAGADVCVRVRVLVLSTAQCTPLYSRQSQIISFGAVFFKLSTLTPLITWFLFKFTLYLLVVQFDILSTFFRSNTYVFVSKFGVACDLNGCLTSIFFAIVFKLLLLTIHDF